MPRLGARLFSQETFRLQIHAGFGVQTFGFLAPGLGFGSFGVSGCDLPSKA